MCHLKYYKKTSYFSSNKATDAQCCHSPSREVVRFLKQPSETALTVLLASETRVIEQMARSYNSIQKYLSCFLELFPRNFSLALCDLTHCINKNFFFYYFPPSVETICKYFRTLPLSLCGRVSVYPNSEGPGCLKGTRGYNCYSPNILEPSSYLFLSPQSNYSALNSNSGRAPLLRVVDYWGTLLCLSILATSVLLS